MHKEEKTENYSQPPPILIFTYFILSNSYPKILIKPNFRRVATRYDKLDFAYAGFVTLNIICLMVKSLC